MKIPRINPEEAAILLIDVQPSFLKYTFPGKDQNLESLVVRLEHLLLLAGWMELPVIAIFEIPIADNGELPERLERVFPKNGPRFQKNFYGSLSENPIQKAVHKLGRSQILLAGAETDVCILQTALGLLEEDFQVFLLEDCLFTSAHHPGPALRRMSQSGAVPCTLKTALYELVQRVDNTPWYPKGFTLGTHPDSKTFPVDFLPPEEWPVWTQKE